MANFEWIDSSALSDAANVYHSAVRVELQSASSNSRIQTIELKLDDFLVLADDETAHRDLIVRVDAMWEQVFTRTKIILLRKVRPLTPHFCAREILKRKFFFFFFFFFFSIFPSFSRLPP
jgi:hypothetical protein